MPVDVKKAKAVEVKPPPLSKGRKGSAIPPELLDAMAETIKGGAFASIDSTFDTKEKAASSLTRFRKAVSSKLPDDMELTGRIWGENKETDSGGNEVAAGPWHFALADKAKQG